jgi:hypothetical protein
MENAVRFSEPGRSDNGEVRSLEVVTSNPSIDLNLEPSSLDPPFRTYVALRRYLKADETRERLLLGLGSKFDKHDRLVRQTDTLQNLLGEPTEAQRLAGEAALQRIYTLSRTQTSKAFDIEPGELILPWKYPIDGLISDPHQKVPTSTIASLEDTVATSETAPTSTGMHTLALTGADIVPSDSTERSKPGPPEPSWPCDADGCNAIFDRENDLRHHKENIHPSALRICEFCRREFIDPSVSGDHVEKWHKAEVERSQCQQCQSHEQKRCEYCDMEATQCQRSMDCLDCHPTLNMPAGAWDVSLLDQIISDLAMEEVASTLMHSAVRTHRDLGEQPTDAVSSLDSATAQRTSLPSPVGDRHLRSVATSELVDASEVDASDTDTEFNLDIDVFLDFWEYEMVNAIIDEVYRQLATEGYPIGRICAGGEQSPVAGRPECLAPSLANTFPGKSTSRKRQRRLPSELSGESEDEHHKRPKSANAPLDRSSQKPPLACPFYKGKPTSRHWKRCTNKNEGWKDITTLRNVRFVFNIHSLCPSKESC